MRVTHGQSHGPRNPHRGLQSLDNTYSRVTSLPSMASTSIGHPEASNGG